MTPGNGSPSGMDRFALDADTAERLVTGAVDVGDAPPGYRAVAASLQALREPPESLELAGGPAVAERIAATVVAARTERAAPRSRRFALRVRVMVASVVACSFALTGSLAAAGELPDSAQRVASAVLGQVGISVPSGDHEPVDHRPVPTTAVPKPTTAASVLSNPTTVSPSAPPPVPPDASVTAQVGPGQERGRTPPARDSVQPAVPADRPGPSPPGNGNGNAYGTTKPGGSANGHGNGNAYAYGKAQASGTENTDPSLALATGSP